jgi:hypothetical protein
VIRGYQTNQDYRKTVHSADWVLTAITFGNESFRIVFDAWNFAHLELSRAPGITFQQPVIFNPCNFLYMQYRRFRNQLSTAVQVVGSNSQIYSQSFARREADGHGPDVRPSQKKRRKHEQNKQGGI